MEDVATDYNIDIDVDMWMDEAPVPMDEDLVKMFEEVCAEGNLDYQLCTLVQDMMLKFWPICQQL